LPEVQVRVFLLCLSLFLCCAASQAQESIATLKTVTGHTWVVRNGETMPASPGMSLFEADQLATDENSSAGVSFLDGSRISLGPASKMEISAYRFAPNDQDYAFEMYFQKGTAYYSSGRLGKLASEKVRFSTPQAVLGVRGTTFLVRVK
jgi:hypothetical protein